MGVKDSRAETWKDSGTLIMESHSSVGSSIRIHAENEKCSRALLKWLLIAVEENSYDNAKRTHLGIIESSISTVLAEKMHVDNK